MKTRAVPLLVVAPACTLLAGVVLYVILSPLMPSHIARHVGPDGVGYSPSWLVVSIMLAAAIIPFAIGGATGRGFFRDDHWYQIQKAVVVCFVSLGYGIVGVALGTIFSTVGLEPNEVSDSSVAMGMLGFLLLFVAAVCVYTALLPRAKPEPSV
ncbi:hypothetical protein [Arthrobacter sp. PAMC 25486]|uniref:hypothetical protein n=1 Tax=Arthrobacter sp. PAMC 25486 TaxID=1494608 RepID=UPI0012FF3DA3|nr:hypothetical protein [Arthrobacter sp. PAMC 25486]